MIYDQILAYNVGRDKDILSLKLLYLRENLFKFFRGTNHLFYRCFNYKKLGYFPQTWICGDLHLENFGSYLASNNKVYFDINDFDEATMMPVSYDLLRMLISIKIAFPHSEELPNLFLDSYGEVIKSGKANFIERDLSKGVIKHLLKKTSKRKNKTLVKERVKKNKFIFSDKIKPILLCKQIQVKGLINQYDSTLEVLDIAKRIAGTSSLGLERYICLVKKDNRKFLLDVKESVSSSVLNRVPLPGKIWKSNSERVVNLQNLLQYKPHSNLSFIDKFIIRTLQPTEDKINLLKLKEKQYSDYIKNVGELTASLHLRGIGRYGATEIEYFLEFFEKENWKELLLSEVDYGYSKVQMQHIEYIKEYDLRSSNQNSKLKIV